MALYNFGVGTIICRRTDIANPTPAFLGVVQDVEIDFDQTLKELTGQYKMPVDIAPAQLKVTGKAKFARIQANLMNDLIFGQTITTGGGEQMSVAQTVAIASTVTPVVPSSGVFLHDLGVFHTLTGVQFARVASAPAVGQYTVTEPGGVYGFNATDVTAAYNLTFYYDYTVTTMTQIVLANQLMGVGPTFEFHAQETYTNNAGIPQTMNIKLNACRSSKFSLPMKNGDYTMTDLDFQAFADQANNWGLLTVNE